MATRDKLTIHEIADKPKILVDKDSNAAKLVNEKFISKTDSNRLRTGSSGEDEIDENEDSEEEEGEEGDGEQGLPAPEFSDIFIKRNGAFENLNSSNKYGILVNDSVDRTSVQIEFKVMIPLDIKDQVTGIEVLSKDEVVAQI